jgi:transposase InsO family protein
MQLRREGYPVTRVCEVVGLPRSSVYHQSRREENAALCVVLHDLAAQYPTYGYRRLTALVRRAGWEVNHKRVQRLMAEMGLQRRVKRRQKRTTDSRHAYWRFPNLVAGLEVTYPDQVWVADITYVALRDEFVYLAVIMDVAHRALPG